MPVPAPTLTDDHPGGHVQSGEQGRGAVAHVVMRHPFDVAQAQGEDGLRVRRIDPEPFLESEEVQLCHPTAAA